MYCFEVMTTAGSEGEGESLVIDGEKSLLTFMVNDKVRLVTQTRQGGRRVQDTGNLVKSQRGEQSDGTLPCTSDLHLYECLHTLLYPSLWPLGGSSRQ